MKRNFGYKAGCANALTHRTLTIPLLFALLNWSAWVNAENETGEGRAGVLSEETIEGGAQADQTNEAADTNIIEEVVVTGSRLKRGTYSSISPLQVISANQQREVAKAFGVNKGTVYSYERADRTPPGAHLTVMAELRADVLYIVTGQRIGETFDVA